MGIVGWKEVPGKQEPGRKGVESFTRSHCSHFVLILATWPYRGRHRNPLWLFTTSTIVIQMPALISHCQVAYWKQCRFSASEAWHTFMSSHYSISAPIRPSRKLVLLVTLLGAG